MKKENIETLIVKYVQENVTEEIKDDFINAAIHFIVNEELCNEYDIMRIKYRLKRIESNEILNYIKLCSVYGYIIYRSVIMNLINEDIKSECCNAIIKISEEVTNYITMKSDEEELYNNIQVAINRLNISDKCNELVLNKVKDVIFSF